MAQTPMTDKQMQQAVDMYARYGSHRAAAAVLKIPVSTFRARCNRARDCGFAPNVKKMEISKNADIHQQLAEAKAKIRALETSAKAQENETLSARYIKKEIIKLKDTPINPPNWLLRAHKKEITGIPTLFASDWHWGEVVDPNQIGGVNSYDLKIAQERARAMVETTIDLCFNHLNNASYEGIVLALGGDMVSGGIHPELANSNELDDMPTVIDLWAVLVWVIETLADKFGKVFVPCVTGNHGRNTFKIQAKNRNYTNFDWLIYQFLAKRFENDKRIQFHIPDGPDAYYSVYNHKYLLTHGDQFRGGDGVIGALGPIIRGDHRKRSRNGQIDMEYDTMILGHWHQLIQLQRLIVNGSLKGYDEYAYTNNFGFEVPRQALWITHPQHGITFSCAVNVDRKKEIQKTEWIGWAK
jgi:hypothetical protein